jgi:AcrR family transcriptional regulator
MLLIGDRRTQLLDAAMQTIQCHGLEHLTLAKVTDIVSVTPAVVSFHFSDKQGLLAETLRHLVMGFDRQLQRVADAIEDPRERLRCVVRMMLDEQVASERHVAVWYAFMGERGWRKVYKQVTGKHDRRFYDFTLQCFRERVRQLGCSLSEQMIDGAARGLIGMLDGFWQEILFRNAGLDRPAAARLCGVYLDLMDCAFRSAANDKGVETS